MLILSSFENHQVDIEVPTGTSSNDVRYLMRGYNTNNMIFMEKKVLIAKRSDISGFYKLKINQRLEKIREFAGLSNEDMKILKHKSALSLSRADSMIENVVSTMQLPVGIATNFLVNGKDYLIPMAIEEPSVIAAASHAAKLARSSGGFKAKSDRPVMIGQIQIVGLVKKECAKGAELVIKNKRKIIKIANSHESTIISLGGGAFDIETRVVDSIRGPMLIVHLMTDVRDAMGANIVNTMCELIAPHISELTGGRVRLRIISNLAVCRMAKATAVWKREVIGADAVEGILDACAFAAADPFRCATHNKGIMNGIDAVALATANDFRATEAGAHCFASQNGYHPLTTYKKNKKGDLVGYIEIPISAGITGGAIRANPTAGVCMKILGVKTSRELAEIMAAVGLAQNFAALRALSTEGIQKGHMKLHANNVAIMAGAKGRLIGKIARKIVKERNITLKRATELLAKLRAKK